MGDRIEWTGSDGARRAVELEAGLVHLSARGGELLATATQGTASLRLVETQRGRRLEPVRPGGTVVVSGAELFCKDLAPGDAFVVDGVRVTWRGGASHAVVPTRSSSLAARPSASREPATPPRTRSHAQVDGAPARERPAARPRANSSKGLVFSLVSLAVLGGIVGLRWLDTQVGQHGPGELLTFARIQFDSGQFDRALKTLDEAESKGAGDARIADAVSRLREEVRRTRADNQKAASVQRAREALDEVQTFADRYGGSSLQRPAARAVVRRLDAWQRDHAAPLRGSKDLDTLLAREATLRRQAEPIAAMATPDTSEDAVFAARSHLRFVVREYKAAVALLEDFLRSNPSDALAQRELQQIRTEAGEWLAAQRALLEQAIARGDRDAARQKLAQIEQHALLAEHAASFANLRGALAQRPVDAPR